MSQKIFSIIIPVKKESDFYIKRAIKNIEKVFKNSWYEIIFSKTYNDNFKLENKPYIKIVNSKEGRGAQLNKGVEVSNGEILIFLHCDTILPENAKDLIINNIEDNAILCFKYSTYPDKIFFKILEFFTNLRCNLTKTPYGDQCFVMYREVFEKSGGFQEEELEDVKFIKNAKNKGFKIKILNAKIKTSPRKYYKHGFLKTVINHRITIARYMLNEFFKSIL